MSNIPNKRLAFISFIMQHRKSFILYGVVGGLTALLYISVFTLLWKVLHLYYQFAVSISYLLAIILHFSINRKVTFKNSNDSVKQQLPRYFILLLNNYLITLLIMHVTVELFALTPYVGIVMGIGITFLINYTLSRFWVFKSQ